MPATAEQLREFLDWLRDGHSRFDAGDQQYFAAFELMETLAARGEWPSDTAAWRTLLAPVLCCSPAQQEQFYELFRTRFGAAAISAEERKDSRDTGARVRQKRLRLAYGAAAVVAVAAVLGGYGWRRLRIPPPPPMPRPPVATVTAPSEPTPIQPTVRFGVVASDGRPVSGATVYYGGEIAITDGNGVALFARVEPAQWVLATHPRFKPAVGRSVPVLTVSPRASSVPAGGWRGWSLQHGAAVSIALAVLPLLLYAGWLIRQIRREIEIRKWTTPLEPKMRQLGLRPGTPLFRGPEMRKLAVGLRRRRPEESAEIAPEPTVEATARTGGYFNAVYAKRSAEPEYLVLGERKNARDHQSRLHDEMFARLRDHDVAIKRYYFQSDPTVCSDGKNQVFTLGELAAIHPYHELWLACEADRMLDPVTGAAEKWVGALCLWRDRVLLSRIRPSADLDMRVTAPTRSGLQALAVEGAHNGAPSAPYPSLLREHAERWLEREDPPPAAVARLVTQLRRYLGPEGYLCLQACAVYPAVAWNITLALVTELAPKEQFESVLDRLCGLPWFRHGILPDWLRIRLVSTLRENEPRVRAAVKSYLETTTEKIRKAEVLDITPSKRGAAKGAGRLQDRVYLAFVERRNLDELSSEAPRGWRKLVLDSLAVRAIAVGVVTCLIAFGGWAGSRTMLARAAERWTVVAAEAPRPSNPFVARLMDVAEARRRGDLTIVADLLDVRVPASIGTLRAKPEPGFVIDVTTGHGAFATTLLRGLQGLGVVERVTPAGKALLFDGSVSSGPFYDLGNAFFAARSLSRMPDTTARPPDWDKSPPESAWCYQEEKPAGSFGVHCHWSQERCNQAKASSTTATSCAILGSLSETAWRPQHPGYMESWYQLGLKAPLPPPFPQFTTSPPKSTESFSPTSGPQRSGDIVWVDDNEDGIRGEIDLLRSIGYPVTWFSTTAEAVKYLGFDNHAAVISDMDRKENGRDLPTAGLDTLREARRVIPNVRFYIYTSVDSAAKYRDVATRSGATGITADPNQLVAWFSGASGTTPKYEPASRIRPIRPGFLFGTSEVRGTICAIVELASGEIGLLSSSHILPATPGVPVFQPPGSNNPDFRVALARSSALTANAAIAVVLPSLTVDQSLPDGAPINGIAEDVRPGSVVKMYGGGSGFVQGTITSVNANANVAAGNGTEILSGVIYVTYVARPGDSGAPVLTPDNRLVGMLYGASQNASIILPIRPILDAFGARLLPPGVRMIPAAKSKSNSQQQQKK